MEKYDGWAIKSFNARNPWLLTWTLERTRKEVIETFEKMWEGEKWKDYRKTGLYQIVKVKLVEVK